MGGGFRSTARVGVTHTTAGRTMLALTFESVAEPQRLYVGELVADTVTLRVVASTAAPDAFEAPRHMVLNYTSSGGLRIEGLLLLPPKFVVNQSSAPLVVFTHCGPAMAQLATYAGYGSVCARFPLAILAAKVRKQRKKERKRKKMRNKRADRGPRQRTKKGTEQRKIMPWRML